MHLLHATQTFQMRSFVLASLLALSLPLVPPLKPLNASQTEESKEQYVQSLRSWVLDLESQVAELRRLEELGNVAQGERDFNEAQLAAIKYEIAKINEDRQTGEPPLQDFIDIEQRRLTRLQPLRRLNAVPAITMIHVRSGLHFGLFHRAQLKEQPTQEIEHLEEFVRLSEQEVASYQMAIQTNSVSLCEVSVANHQLLYARYLLGKRQDNLNEILPEILKINARLKTDWLAAKKLHERRLINLLDAYFMQLYYLESQLLIAAIEDAEESMVDLLQQRVSLHDEVLKKGREVGWGPTVAIYSQLNLEYFLSCSSAFDQFLLSRLEESGEFEYESMLLFGL